MPRANITCPVWRSTSYSGSVLNYWVPRYAVPTADQKPQWRAARQPLQPITSKRKPRTTKITRKAANPQHLLRHRKRYDGGKVEKEGRPVHAACASPSRVRRGQRYMGDSRTQSQVPFHLAHENQPNKRKRWRPDGVCYAERWLRKVRNSGIEWSRRWKTPQIRHTHHYRRIYRLSQSIYWYGKKQLSSTGVYDHPGSSYFLLVSLFFSTVIFGCIRPV